ncbi:nucleotidyltransferase family protein [Fibrobacter sp.]|uniref:nucleotidyltransferase family protein n=1 Tax=Fibrobacter sp. TaxID=35828 RepID=UPI001B17A9B2|nr:nucleotidyltransferase domain-containing protein [Fibrobacter sp.]MBO7062086.1 nucleotidyltransferase domain-containing protein [Fibrobacter sp.]MBO7106105.1 nucleotidyltransferase domain-containing protein [Fibrobacter sp.]MBR3670332.1 nucleotidyltransferase domain-containing protein [Fibrobacter sp.]
MNLPAKIQLQIRKFAEDCGLERVVLFGSRARGSNRERSDIDLAVSGKDVELFVESLEERADTLLSFDIVNLDEIVSDKLRESINREGKVLYAKI